MTSAREQVRLGNLDPDTFKRNERDYRIVHAPEVQRPEQANDKGGIGGPCAAHQGRPAQDPAAWWMP